MIQINEKPYIIQNYLDWKDYEKSLIFNHWFDQKGKLDESGSNPISFPCLVYSFEDHWSDGPDSLEHVFVYVDDAEMLLNNLKVRRR